MGRPDHTDSSRASVFGPRPELEADGLYGVVNGACGGAKLSFAQGRWRIEPHIDPSDLLSSWHDQAAWEASRGRNLVPHRERLAALLRLLPSPRRLGAPPDPLTAGVTALRALGWRLGLNPKDGLTAEHPPGGAPGDAPWMEVHHHALAELLSTAEQPTGGKTP